MSVPKRYYPGQRAPVSAQWAAHDAHGQRIPRRQCTLPEGKRFPPIVGYVGGYWAAPDLTRHKED